MTLNDTLSKLHYYLITILIYVIVIVFFRWFEYIYMHNSKHSCQLQNVINILARKRKTRKLNSL